MQLEQVRPGIIRPKLAAIDSSLLASWAKDALSSMQEPKARAIGSLEAFFEKNWIPVICWHHFDELIRYPEMQVVANRIAFLKSLPQVAWISSSMGSNDLGSIVDLFDAEVKEIVIAKDIERGDLVSSVREHLVRYGTPAQITTLDDWEELRPLLMANRARQQEVASIVHVENRSDDKVRIVSLNKAKPKDRASRERFIKRYAVDIEQDLKLRGDRRLRDSAGTARKFTSSIAENIEEMCARNVSPLEAFATQFDVPMSDISNETTLAEFKQIARRRRLLRGTSSRLGLELEAIWPTLRYAKIPSEIIQAQIRRARKSVPRTSGSDLGDDYLTCLAPYVDAIVVDKRTHEFLNQCTRRDPVFSGMVGFFTRAATYESLPQALAPLAPIEG